MNEGKVQYFYVRFKYAASFSFSFSDCPNDNLFYILRVGPGFKYAYIPWCGPGVAGMLKGSFSNHAIDFNNYLKVFLLLSSFRCFVLPPHWPLLSSQLALLFTSK